MTDDTPDTSPADASDPVRQLTELREATYVVLAGMDMQLRAAVAAVVSLPLQAALAAIERNCPQEATQRIESALETLGRWAGSVR